MHELETSVATGPPGAATPSAGRSAIPITRPTLPSLDEYTRLLEQIWSSRMLSNFGSFAQQLEELTSDYLGIPTRVVVSGDIGLTLAIAALELPAGSACLVPSYTFNSTVNAVLWNGLRPVFVDIDPATFNMDPEAAATAALGADVRLIVGTHVFGNPADVDRLADLAASTGARLLFDAAHGYGSVRRGTKVGAFGDAEIFSLSGTKLVTSAEGGIVSSGDEDFLDRFGYARGYGFRSDYNSRMLGLNGKMSELHAALGTLALREVEEAVAGRSAQVERYRRQLDGIGLVYQAVDERDRSTYKDFAVVFADGEMRDRVEADLAGSGIQTKRYFRPCHQMDAFAPYAAGPLPVTEDLYARVLCLPVYRDLSDAQIDEVCRLVRRSASGE